MAKMPAANAATLANNKVWARAKKHYADPGIRISDIAKSLGISAIELSVHAKHNKWPLRSGKVAKVSQAPKTAKAKKHTKAVKAAPKTRTEKSKSKAAKDKTAAPVETGAEAKPATLRPILLVRRVYNTIDGELTKLENQTGASSQDRERASRALSQMVSSLEKAIDMQREMTKTAAKGSGTKDKEALAHAEDLRRTVAERIERLHRERLAGKRSK
jgi:hypothetical protein